MAAFIEKAAAELGLRNVSVEPVRAEEAGGFGSYDAATARALGSLPLVLEYAAPLLREAQRKSRETGMRKDWSMGAAPPVPRRPLAGAPQQTSGPRRSSGFRNPRGSRSRKASFAGRAAVIS